MNSQNTGIGCGLVLGLMLVIALLAYRHSEPVPYPYARPLTAMPYDNATIDEYGSVVITGVIRNSTGYLLRRVSVRFGVYDQQGNVMGVVADACSLGIEPGQGWRYRASGYYPGSHKVSALPTIDY